MIRIDIHDGASRRTIDCDADPVHIGRDPQCEVTLPGDATVSRCHAVLGSTPDGWLLTDWGSRNGTFVNGRPLAEPQLIAPTDRVLIGQYVLVLLADNDRLVETADVGDAGPGRAQWETGLSPREIEVLRLVVAGDTDQQIADQLYISVKTVHSHLERIRDKTGCRRRPELMRFAIDHGLS